MIEVWSAGVILGLPEVTPLVLCLFDVCLGLSVEPGANGGFGPSFFGGEVKGSFSWLPRGSDTDIGEMYHGGGVETPLNALFNSYRYPLTL